MATKAYSLGLTGPYSDYEWDPKAMHDQPTPDPTWELSSVILRFLFFSFLSIIILEQVYVVCRGIRHLIHKVNEKLLRRYAAGLTKGASAADRDLLKSEWNQIHVKTYTPRQVEYVDGKQERYYAHEEDYVELFKVLNFMNDYGHLF